MDTVSVILALVLVILCAIWMSSKQKGRKLPPGPTGLPIVGYLPFMTSKPYIKLTELSKTYGPVYQVKLGSRDTVVITDFKLMKEAFMKDAFFGRPQDLPFNLSKENIETQAFLGYPWKELRRFSLQQLRDMGFGKSRMEEHMKEEIEEVITFLKEAKEPVRISDILAPSTSNNIASFVFGNRLPYNDPKRKELDQIMSNIGRFAGTTVWTQFFPWISAFLQTFRLGNCGKLIDSIEEEKTFLREEIRKHGETLDSNTNRDFVDGFLQEMKKNANDPHTIYQMEILVDVAAAFFGAGSETVRVAVDWVVLVAAADHHVQKRMQDEIEDALGSDRFPSWEDRHRMPYTEAVIAETMRWKTSVPLNIMRSTLSDTELNGYFIPKETRVLGIIWAVDHDPSLWGDDVYEFKPERFLSSDGKKVVKPEHFMPFSIGKRSCPGKALAEVEVFLYVSALLQNFTISLPHGKTADFDEVLGIGLQPKRQELCFEFRH